jgi:hypothetical protein
MARGIAADFLQDFAFWLFDAGPISWDFGYPILTPIFGFKSVTAPTISVETVDIREANWIFAKKAVRRASIGNMTLHRGATFYDADFYRWINFAITGDVNLAKLLGVAPNGGTPRRSFVLIQFFSHFPNPMANSSSLDQGAGQAVAGAIEQTALVSGGVALAGGSAAAVGAAALQTAVFSAGGALLSSNTSGGPFEFFPRIPAKAWLLQGCLPVKYKPSGDFEGSSSNISIGEVEMAVEFMEEITLLG